MMRLVKTAPKPAPATGLTMGGPPPRLPTGTQPGLTFAQGFASMPMAASAAAGPRLATCDGVRVETA